MSGVSSKLVTRLRDKAHATAVLNSVRDPTYRWYISNGVHSISTSYVRNFVYSKLRGDEDEAS